VAHERDFGAVLDGARAGAPWAVAALFEDLQPRLLRYLRSRDRDAAEDIAAEVWEAIARGIRSFDGDEAGFRGWAFTIARRRLIDARRRTARRQTAVSATETFDGLPAVDVTDVEAIERLSAEDAVTLITATLSEEQADVVLLRVVAGVDTAAVAEMMQRTETWVRVTQHRALKKLAETLGPKISAPM